MRWFILGYVWVFNKENRWDLSGESLALAENENRRGGKRKEKKTHPLPLLEPKRIDVTPPYTGLLPFMLSRLDVIPPRHRRHGLLHHVRPAFHRPHHQARDAPPHDHAHSSLGPDRYHLRLLHCLVHPLLEPRGVRRAGQVDQDGAAERADGVENIDDAARRIRGYVADGVDGRGGSAQGFGVGTHVAAVRQPGGRKEGGVWAGAGGVDVDVDGARGVVRERQGGLRARGRGGDDS